MGTDGNNSEISCEMVASRIGDWDKRFGLVVWAAGGGGLDAEFEQQPVDMYAFAQEVYEFCPDVVNQGTGAVDPLAAEMKRCNGFSLGWD
jgi:hypothetical protein